MVSVDKYYDQLQYMEATGTENYNMATPDGRLIYCKAALEAKFPERKFSVEEVRKLIKEEYGQDL